MGCMFYHGHHYGAQLLFIIYSQKSFNGKYNALYLSSYILIIKYVLQCFNVYQKFIASINLVADRYRLFKRALYAFILLSVKQKV